MRDRGSVGGDMKVTEAHAKDLHRLDMLLYDRPAGRNIVGYAVDTINNLQQQRHNMKQVLLGLLAANKTMWEVSPEGRDYIQRIEGVLR